MILFLFCVFVLLFLSATGTVIRRVEIPVNASWKILACVHQALAYTYSQHVQPIKIDIGKAFDKSITIDNAKLNVINFIDQSIKLDAHNRSWS